MLKKVGRVFGIIFLAALSFAGLYNAVNELPHEESALQMSVGFAQLLYGLLGLMATVGFIRRRPWVVTITAAWGLAATYTASVASFAFHDPTFSEQGTIAGVLGACFSCLLMTALFVWFARVTVRSKLPTAQ